MKNLPDDYSLYYKTCTKCNYRFHFSEGACPKCLDEINNETLKTNLNKILNPERND